MADENVDEHWFTAYWRPAVAWGYLFICIFDFFLAPMILGWYTIYTHVPYIPWEPLTLKGGGMLHLSMGGIAGVSAWSRGREKIAGMEFQQAREEMQQPPVRSRTDRSDRDDDRVRGRGRNNRDDEDGEQ